MILSAAIKFRIKDCDEEIVMCGCRHGDIYAQLDKLGIPSCDVLEHTEGFITHHNDFLTRKEAFEHAKLCGQLSLKIIYDREHGGVGGKNLISEDLW